MSKLSKSPERYTFQKEGYVNRCLDKGEEPRSDYLDYFQKIIEDHDHKFDNPNNRKNNLEYDLLTTEWILEKIRKSRVYSQNLYAALCNNEFQKLDVVPILKDEKWSCSWRYAGGIIADMRQKGDYIDWYCSGIRDSGEPTEEEWNAWDQDQQNNWMTTYSKYVAESVVVDEISEDLKKLGWIVLEEQDNE